MGYQLFEPKPSGRLLTEQIKEILEVWQDEGTDYVTAFSFGGVAIEITRLVEAHIEALIEWFEEHRGIPTEKRHPDGRCYFTFEPKDWYGFKATIKGEEG